MRILILLLALCLANCGTDFDFYEEYYRPCIDLCNVANDWLESCGHGKVSSSDCVDKVWYTGYTKELCDIGRNCYEQIMGQECLPDPPTSDWYPSTHVAGCPIP